jgi:hypothetical protein
MTHLYKGRKVVRQVTGKPNMEYPDSLDQALHRDVISPKRKREVSEKPNHAVFLEVASGSEENGRSGSARRLSSSPLRARVEVTAKPTMLDPTTREFRWKTLQGDPFPHQAEYQPRRESMMVERSLSPRPSPSSRVTVQLPERLPAGYSPHIHHDVPIPQVMPPAQKLTPISTSPRNDASVSTGYPAASSSSVIMQPILVPPTTVPSQRVGALTINSFPNQIAPYPVESTPSTGMMPWSATASDLERIVARNYEEAQKSFLRF